METARQAILQLHKTNDNTIRSQADSWLRDFIQSPDNWPIVITLLSD